MIAIRKLPETVAIVAASGIAMLTGGLNNAQVTNSWATAIEILAFCTGKIIWGRLTKVANCYVQEQSSEH